MSLEQQIIPNFVQFLRSKETTGIGAAGPTYAGSLFCDGRAWPGSGCDRRVFERTHSGAWGMGIIMVCFICCAGRSHREICRMTIYGLQQKAENRTNVVFINTGETDDSVDVFHIEIFE